MNSDSPLPESPDAAAAEWLRRQSTGVDLAADPGFSAWLGAGGKSSSTICVRSSHLP